MRHMLPLRIRWKWVVRSLMSLPLQGFFIADVISILPIDYILLIAYGPKSDAFRASRCVCLLS